MKVKYDQGTSQKYVCQILKEHKMTQYPKIGTILVWTDYNFSCNLSMWDDILNLVEKGLWKKDCIRSCMLNKRPIPLLITNERK